MQIMKKASLYAPDCGEPIYEWDEYELQNEDGEYICPICEEVL